MLEEVAGGYAFRASREAAHACARLFERPVERGLSQAALETLAIVAYLGPCSRPDIARIRGVAADSAVASLVERGLIAEAGRETVPAERCATGRRRSSSGSSGSRASRRCRASTISARTPTELRERLLEVAESPRVVALLSTSQRPLHDLPGAVLRSTGRRRARRPCVIPSTASSGLPIMKSTWTLLLLMRARSAGSSTGWS